MVSNLARGSRVLVTGAAGFIGSHLVQGLLAQGVDVVGIDRRCIKSDSIAALNLAEVTDHPRLTLIEGDLLKVDLLKVAEGVDRVFHLAAVPGVRPSWGDFEDYLISNVLATQRVLTACEQLGVARLVYASSSSVYGPADKPSTEDDPTRPISPYGVTKLAGENLCLAHALRLGSRLSVTALRYFTVYGPRQRPDMAIGRILAASLTGEQYAIFGDGSQRREFTFVDDVVEATIAAANVVLPAAVINIGGGSTASMIDVIGLARETTGNPVPLTAINRQAGDVPATAADLSRARDLLGYEPRTDLRTGMALHAQWLRQLPPKRLLAYAPPAEVTDQEESTCSL
jgi:nucleoside-diphosphate-sugar epimerase